MNPSYRHLNVLEREKLMILLHTGFNQAEIARQTGHHPSTISRELRRHKLENYSAQRATESYQRNRLRSKAQKKLTSPEYRHLVEDKILKQQWSPEQLSYRLKKEKSELSISYATIYRAFNAGMFDIEGRKATRHLRPLKCLGWKTPYEVYFSKSLHLVGQFKAFWGLIDKMEDKNRGKSYPIKL